jgi:hypothetical protein
MACDGWTGAVSNDTRARNTCRRVRLTMRDSSFWNAEIWKPYDEERIAEKMRKREKEAKAEKEMEEAEGKRSCRWFT